MCYIIYNQLNFLIISATIMVCANAQKARITAMKPNVAENIKNVHTLNPDPTLVQQKKIEAKAEKLTNDLKKIEQQEVNTTRSKDVDDKEKFKYSLLPDQSASNGSVLYFGPEDGRDANETLNTKNNPEPDTLPLLDSEDITGSNKTTSKRQAEPNMERRIDQVPRMYKTAPTKSYTVLDKRGNMHTHTFSEEHIHINDPVTSSRPKTSSNKKSRRPRVQKRTKSRPRKSSNYPRDFIVPPVPKNLRKTPPRFEDLNQNFDVKEKLAPKRPRKVKKQKIKSKSAIPSPKPPQNKTLQDYLVKPEDIILTTEHTYDITEEPIYDEDDSYPFPLDGPIVLPQDFHLDPPIQVGGDVATPVHDGLHHRHKNNHHHGLNSNINHHGSNNNQHNVGSNYQSQKFDSTAPGDYKGSPSNVQNRVNKNNQNVNNHNPIQPNVGNNSYKNKPSSNDNNGYKNQQNYNNHNIGNHDYRNSGNVGYKKQHNNNHHANVGNNGYKNHHNYNGGNKHQHSTDNVSSNLNNHKLGNNDYNNHKPGNNDYNSHHSSNLNNPNVGNNNYNNHHSSNVGNNNYNNHHSSNNDFNNHHPGNLQTVNVGNPVNSIDNNNYYNNLLSDNRPSVQAQTFPDVNNFQDVQADESRDTKKVVRIRTKRPTEAQTQTNTKIYHNITQNIKFNQETKTYNENIKNTNNTETSSGSGRQAADGAKSKVQGNGNSSPNRHVNRNSNVKLVSQNSNSQNGTRGDANPRQRGSVKFGG
ncbi:putative uncharacterized protein DDB_G0282133 isoform X2 [Ctenocephalides felis]|uniref:putative uncharacterized protein DDB_G0282133 isoform X2 n=2 Tax=Ctenocephalides felis TaxID=7515 RepID=UPI000E6E59BC|nr:putative uncharacterized protein DDB_G0282133 isoform X2 [Ctenocephalides felis]